MRLEKREETSVWLVLTAPFFAIAVALILTSSLIIWSGHSPFDAYFHMAKGGFGSRFAISETLARATPMILTGLAASVAFKAKFWNIGAEGQLYAGALATTVIGTGMFDLPMVLMIPCLFVVGALSGGATLMLPVYLKTRLKVDEVVSTLLLNFVVLLFVSYLLEGPLKDPMSLGWPQAEPIVDEGILPPLLAKTRLHMGVIVAVISAVFVWVLMRFTIWGYEIRAVGASARAASFVGVSMNTTVLRVALISGGLAGMAGVTEVAGLKGYLTLDLSPGFGYAGIAVAMLAGLNPLGVILSAIFLAGVFVGAGAMSRMLDIPTYIADVLVASCVLSVLVSLMFTQFKLKLR